MRVLLAATAVVTTAAGYALSCLLWPFARCRICDGHGHHSPKRNRRISRPCWWCKGGGRRLRLGRRLWNHYRN